ncbi:hypothetical protein B0H12DRAFT_273148 [Mycena haematopus]|nr:hypothetical protein B0H12DRAFT_273148 [Mycena haematopus]
MHYNVRKLFIDVAPGRIFLFCILFPSFHTFTTISNMEQLAIHLMQSAKAAAKGGQVKKYSQTPQLIKQLERRGESLNTARREGNVPQMVPLNALPASEISSRSPPTSKCGTTHCCPSASTSSRRLYTPITAWDSDL